MIKKIHQVWIQGPQHYQDTHPHFYKFSQRLQELFPDFEYKLWGETDFLPLMSLKLQETYKSAPSFSAKSDIARYWILEREGGHYADTDYEPFKRYDYLFEHMDLVVVAMHLSKNKLLFGNYRYGTAWMYATPHHTLCQHMLQQFEETPFDKKKFTPFDYAWQITGPKGFGNMMVKLNLEQNSKVRILPHPMIETADFSTVAMASMSEQEILKEYPYAVGVHRMDGSWIANAKSIKQTFGVFYTWLTSWNDFINIGLASCLLLLPLIIWLIWAVRRRQKKH